MLTKVYLGDLPDQLLGIARPSDISLEEDRSWMLSFFVTLPSQSS